MILMMFYQFSILFFVSSVCLTNFNCIDINIFFWKKWPLLYYLAHQFKTRISITLVVLVMYWHTKIDIHFTINNSDLFLIYIVTTLCIHINGQNSINKKKVEQYMKKNCQNFFYWFDLLVVEKQKNTFWWIFLNEIRSLFFLFL